MCTYVVLGIRIWEVSESDTWLVSSLAAFDASISTLETVEAVRECGVGWTTTTTKGKTVS